MKQTIISILAIAVVLSIAFGFTQKAYEKTARTEEYAIVDVMELGKKKVIRVTIGEKSMEEVILENEKDKLGDFSYVMKELNKLNEQGFELVDASMAYNTAYINASIQRLGDPRHTFILRKKI